MRMYEGGQHAFMKVSIDREYVKTGGNWCRRRGRIALALGQLRSTYGYPLILAGETIWMLAFSMKFR